MVKIINNATDQASVGQLLRMICELPIPQRDGQNVREFVALLPKNQNVLLDAVWRGECARICKEATQ